MKLLKHPIRFALPYSSALISSSVATLISGGMSKKCVLCILTIILSPAIAGTVHKRQTPVQDPKITAMFYVQEFVNKPAKLLYFIKNRPLLEKFSLLTCLLDY
jgi:hypothetical protein